MSPPKIIHICNKEITDKLEHYSQNWKNLNPEYEIKLYDDKMCEQFLLEEMSQLHYDIFKFIPDGPIKCDFWRCCILYKYGGVYADADIKPVLPLREFIEEDSNFVTCLSYYAGYNLHFIISEPGEDIFKFLIDKYIDYYTSKKNYDYWPWSICRLFDIYTGETRILNNEEYNNEGNYIINNKKYQLLKDVFGAHYYDNHCVYNNKILFYTRHDGWDSEGHKFW